MVYVIYIGFSSATRRGTGKRRLGSGDTRTANTRWCSVSEVVISRLVLRARRSLSVISTAAVWMPDIGI